MALFQQVRYFLDQGGFTAFLIVLTGIVLLILAWERLSYLYFRVSYDSDEALNVIKDLILKRNYTQALQICNQQPVNPELQVVKSGILAVESGREAMKSSLNGAVIDISRKCETRLPFLALIASAATILGLLGTITGLIRTFAGMASVDASEKARLLGSGISEAMYSTGAGLVIGLLAMVIHTICVSKVDGIVGKAQQAGLNVVTWIEQSERARAEAPRQVHE